jgi:hypothetical protein
MRPRHDLSAAYGTALSRAAFASGRDGSLQGHSGVDAGGPGNQSREERTSKREDRTVSIAMYVIEHTGRIPQRSQALLRGREDGNLVPCSRANRCTSASRPHSTGRSPQRGRGGPIQGAAERTNPVNALTPCQCEGWRFLSLTFDSEPAGVMIGHSCGASIVPPGPSARRERDSPGPCASP